MRFPAPRAGDTEFKESANDYSIDDYSQSMSNIVLSSNVDGKIDNAMMFDRALDSTEIQFLAFPGNYNQAFQNNLLDIQFDDTFHTPAFNSKDSNIVVVDNPSYSNGYNLASKSI